MNDVPNPDDKTPLDHGPPAAMHFEEGEETVPPGVRVMAVVRWLLVLAMAIAAVASSVYVFGDKGHADGADGVQYYCPMHPSVVQDHPGECPICSMSLVARELAGAKDRQDSAAPASKRDHTGHRHEAADPFYCPMHPEETGVDANAKCPLCGMKLERKPDAAAPKPHAAAPSMRTHAPTPAAAKPLQPKSAEPLPASVPGLIAIDIPADRVQLIGMRTAKAERTTLPSLLKTVGYLAPTESGFAVVQTRFSGWIQELHVRQTGEPVARGQLLARVYSPQIFAAQQELLNAKQWTSAPAVAPAEGRAAPSLLENARTRLLLMGMDPKELAEVERTGAAHRLIELRSPVRGYVAQKNAVEGLYLEPGTRLFEVADLSKVWLLADVSERDAGRVRAGQAATLTLAAFPGEEFCGKVQLIYPALNAQTRTLRARIEFKNPELRLRPGMFGDVAIQVSAAEGLVVPREAVVDTGESQYVFVVESAGRFAPRPVRVGERSSERVQVLAGLVADETVVTTGNFLIDSESRLRATIEGSANRPASSEHRH